MAVFVSHGTKAGTTWSAGRPQEHSRPGAYCDLVQLDGATVRILCKTGQTSWKERIDFRSLGSPTSCAVAPARSVSARHRRARADLAAPPDFGRLRRAE